MASLAFKVRRFVFVLPWRAKVSLISNKLQRGGKAGPARQLTRHPIDVEYDIDTGGTISAGELATGRASDLQNFGYAGSQPSILRDVLKLLPNLDTANFVDIGTGKGRPLAVASEFPFKRIIGVELSPQLAASARDNARRIAARHPNRTAIEVAEQDALTFEIPPGYTVVYFYSSMYAQFLERLCAGLAEQAAQRPDNRVLFIYYNPVFAKTVDANRSFKRFYAARHVLSANEQKAAEWGNVDDSVVIWQTGPAPHLEPHSNCNAHVRMGSAGTAGIVD